MAFHCAGWIRVYPRNARDGVPYKASIPQPVAPFPDVAVRRLDDQATYVDECRQRKVFSDASGQAQRTEGTVCQLASESDASEPRAVSRFLEMAVCLGRLRELAFRSNIGYPTRCISECQLTDLLSEEPVNKPYDLVINRSTSCETIIPSRPLHQPA